MIDPITLMAIAQGAGGLIQTISGGIQRQRAERAARERVESLKPDLGLLGYYDKALQRYSGLRAGEGAMQKQYTRGAQQNLANVLRQYRQLGPGGILAGGASALRAANEGVMKGAAVGEQMAGQALGQLGSAAQIAAAEKRRQQELKLQMDLAKAAGGTQIANVGMSNIFGALESGATNKLYKDIYGKKA